MKRILLFLFILSVYIFTSSPTISTGDSGEFITGAYTLGISHPPGFPLYSITGKIFSLMPFSNTAWRISFGSMIFSVLASFFIFTIVFSFTKEYFSSIIASAVFSFSRTVWSQSIIAEAYMLNAFFCVFCLFLLLKLSEKYEIKYFYLFIFTFSLSLTNHYPLMVLSSFGYLIYIFPERQNLKSINYRMIALLIFVPLFVYVYMPIRSGLNPPLNWGSPDNLNGFISHVFRLQYKTVELSKDVSILDKVLFIKHFLYGFFRQFYFFLLLMPFGAAYLYKKNRSFLFSLGTITFFNSLVLIMILKFNFNPERAGIVEVYYLPSYIAGALLTGFGAAYILKSINRRFVRIAVVFLFFIFLYINSVKSINKTQRYNFLEYDYINNILMYLEKDSNLFIQQAGDESLFGVLYAKEVLDKRRDVKFYDCYGNVNNIYGPGFSLINDKREWLKRRIDKEKSIILNQQAPSYYLTFTPGDIPFLHHREFTLKKCGLFTKVLKTGKKCTVSNPWHLYSARNTDVFYNDYQEQEITGFYNYLTGLETTNYKYFEKVYLNSQNVSWVVNNAGLSLLRNGHFEESKKYFKKVVSLYRNNLAAYHNLGLAMKNTSDYKSAAFYFQKCINEDLGDFESHKELAETYMLMNYTKKGENILTNVLKGNTKIANNYFYDGARHYKEGNIAEAIDAWHKSSLVNPDFAIVYYNLGVAYLDAGHRGKAYTNFKIFLDKEKTGRTAKIVREHIKNIKY